MSDPAEVTRRLDEAIREALGDEPGVVSSWAVAVELACGDDTYAAGLWFPQGQALWHIRGLLEHLIDSDLRPEPDED